MMKSFDSDFKRKKYNSPERKRLKKKKIMKMIDWTKYFYIYYGREAFLLQHAPNQYNLLKY
jgi:hypothetical protein